MRLLPLLKFLLAKGCAEPELIVFYLHGEKTPALPAPIRPFIDWLTQRDAALNATLWIFYR